MTRLAFALVLVAPCGAAFGQLPGYPAPQSPQPVSPPNFGARQPQQPLSPYLNLLNGVGNPAVNYYNIARPFLQPPPSPFAAPPGMLPQPGAFPAQVGYLRAPALPPASARDPADPTADGSTLPPTGHPVTFGNRTPGGRSGFLPTGAQPGQTKQPTTMPRAKK